MAVIKLISVLVLKAKGGNGIDISVSGCSQDGSDKCSTGSGGNLGISQDINVDNISMCILWQWR